MEVLRKSFWRGATLFAAAGVMVALAASGETASALASSRAFAVATEPVWSPDGRKIAFVASTVPGYDAPRRLYVMNAEGPASPPDGMIVYVCGARLNGLCRVDADGRNPRTLARTDSTSFYATPSLSADGKRLAYVFANRAYAADPLGRNRHLLSDALVEAVSLRPDGQRILLLTPVGPCPGPLACPIGMTGTLVDWSGADAHRRSGFFASADWLSARRLVAISAHQPSSLLTVPVAGCCGRLFLEAGRLRFGEVAVSPDGETLAVSTYATIGSSVEIYLIDRHTKAIRRLSPPARSGRNDLYYSPAWSPDGTWLVFVRQDARRPLQRMLMIARAVPGSHMVSLGVLGVQPAWGPSG